jgi:hypothetical protein
MGKRSRAFKETIVSPVSMIVASAPTRPRASLAIRSISSRSFSCEADSGGVCEVEARAEAFRSACVFETTCEQFNESVAATIRINVLLISFSRSLLRKLSACNLNPENAIGED